MAADPYADSVRRVMAERVYGPIYSAQYADAQKSAAANEAARRLGVPPELVEADFPNMMAEDRLRKRYAETLSNPVYSRMMSNPRFAAAAIDDDKLPELANRVQSLRELRNDRGFQAWAARLRESTALAPVRPNFGARAARHGTLKAIGYSLQDWAGAVYAAAGQGLFGLAQAHVESAGSRLNPAAPLLHVPNLLAGLAGIDLYDAQANSLRGAGRYYARQRELSTVEYDNRIVNDVIRGTESIPLSVAALLAASRGRPDAGVALLSAISGGASYAEGREEGLTPGRAALYGATQGGLEAVGERLPLVKYADDALRGSGFFKRLGGQLVAENVGEQFTGHLQDFNRWASIDANKGKGFDEYLAERPGAALSIALGTTGAVGLQTSAAYGIEKAANRLRQRQEDKAGLAFLDRVMDGAAEVGTRKSNPSDFAAALATELEGSEAENVYIPAEAIRSLYQSGEELADDPFWGPRIDEIAEADALGGDIIVPLAEVATALAGSPQWRQLREHVRLGAGGSSRAEIAAYEAEFDDANRAAGEQLAEMLAEELDRQEPVQRVHDAMRDKLMLAGFTPDAASNLATSYAQRQRVRAERRGEYLRGDEADLVEVRQVLPQRLAKVEAGQVPDASLTDVIKEMKRGRGVRSDKAKFGPSLLDWIQSKGGVEDPGGDLKSMGASPIKGVAKKGQRKIIRPSGLAPGMFGGSTQQNANTLDEMALRAWEAGYFPEFGDERPTVNDLLAAIEDGLAGRDRYAEDRQTEEDDLRMAAQELYALLDQQGIDPDKASAREIQQAVRRYQAEQQSGGVTLEQNLFDDPAQPQRSMTPEQRAELEARQKQSMARRGGQVALSDQEGGLFSAERDQRSLFQGNPAFAAWRSLVDRLVRGEHVPDRMMTLGETPSVLTDLGLPAGKLVMSPGKLKRVRREHDVPISVLHDLPSLIADPLAVFPSGRAGSMIVATVAADRAGKPIIVPIEAAKEGNATVVLSIYGKESGAEWIEREINKALKAGDPVFLGKGFAATKPQPPSGSPDSPSAPIAVGGATKPARKILSIKEAVKKQFDQTYGDGPRGRITFMPGRPSVIELFEKRDLSTFIHETGHLYLEELREDAAFMGEGQLLDDWNTVVAWFKANGHDISPDGTIPTEAHEMFARGFERYTMEGKAPSSALRKAFEAFRSWLLNIYKVVDNLRAPITPEIRDVMARLIATDEEIEAARGEQQIKALFTTAAEAGMTEAEFAEYQKATEESRDEAFDALLYRTMAPIRAARTKQHKEREAAVRSEVMAEIDAMPLYRALRLIKSGEDGTPMRLSRQWLIDTYGEDILDALPRSVPPLYADKGTLDADTIAERAGFSSGDQMVKMLLGHEEARQSLRAAGDKRSPRQVAIDEATADTMATRYGDPLRDGSIEEEARAIIHNDKQGEVIASEARALGRRTGNRPTPYAIAKRWAAEKIKSGQVNETISGAALQRYQRAARNAAKAAETAILAGDVDEAFRQKQAQMLNNALVAEGLKAKDAVDAAVRRLSRTARRKASKSIDQGYLDQAHALLESVEFRQRSQTSIDRQESFEEWAQAQRAAGVDIATPAGFAATIGQRNWSRLTVEEIIGLDDTVKQILHLGRLKQTLLDGQERRERDEVIAEMRATADSISKGPPTALNDPSRDWLAGAKSKLLGLDAALIKIEQLVDWLDQGNPNGIFNRMIFKPLADAQGREADMMRDYVGRINEAVAAMPKKQLKDWRRRVDTPELLNRIEGHPSEGQPWQFYKDQIVMIALNWGNAGNRQRLLDGYRWNEAQVEAVLDRLMTAEDWTFVQSVWDTIDGLWPDIEALEKRVNGFAPDRVEATPISNRHGDFRGGYFPAVYDPNYSSRTDDQQAESLIEQGYLRANVRSGSTKARAAQVRRPILLTMDVITRHLGEVIHDVTHREALTETWRLVSDERVQRIITNALGREYTALLKPWLKHIANDQARNANSNSHVVGFLRRLGYNVSIVGMGYRLTTVFAQVAGIPNIIAQIGERRVLEGWGRFLRNPVSAYREVTEKSAEMRDRFSTMDRDIIEAARVNSKGRIEDIAGGGWFRKYAYHGILIADAMLTTAGWIGAYRKGAAEGMSEQEAVYYADKVVRKSQGAGGAKDQAAIMREHEAVRLFVKFFSYFSALYNQQRDFGHRLRRITGYSDAGRVLHFGFWAMIAPPLVDALIRGELPGGDDDEDDESVGAWAAQKILFGNLASIPFVRDIGGAIDRDFGYKMTPIQNIGEGVIQGWGNLRKALDGDDETEVSSRWVKQTLNAIGLIMGLPTGQFASSAQFGADVATGEQEPETAEDVYRGVTTGNMEPAN